MPKQDIVVIGASAGGVEALQELVADLPKNLEAAIFVVLHIGTGINGQSRLPEILTKAGRVPAVHPGAFEQIRHGRIYVAKPDCHMIVADGHVRAVHGPKEHRTRPAINPLFRSAAATYGGRVTGVILSGTQDDGVAGLAEIKRKGGVAVVQEPSTALFSSMPQNAIEQVEADYIAPIHEIADIISRLAVTDRAANVVEESMERTLLEMKCPECAGPLWEERQGKLVEYRCRVGHAYSPLALQEEHQESIERSLWASVVALENAADLLERLAREMEPVSTQDAQEKRGQATKLREIIENTKSLNP